MIIELLPSHSREPGRLQTCTTFLLNGRTAIDAGSLGIALSVEQYLEIDQVIITHTHADHIAGLPLFIAEAFPRRDRPLSVFASAHDIQVLMEHVFNDDVWPDFTRIPLKNGEPSVTFVEIQAYREFCIGELAFTAIPVNHTVPCLGLALKGPRSSVLFTADTFTTDEIWRFGRELDNLACVYADVSYPDEEVELSEAALHYHPSALAADLEKLGRTDAEILAVHLKPQFRDRVKEQIEALGMPNFKVAEIGRKYEW